MNTISIKRSEIEPLWSYEPKLNDWSHQAHQISKEDCDGILKILKPILETIKKEANEEKLKNHYHFTPQPILEKLDSCKQMIKVFTLLKPITNEEITLDFNF
jgi:hypothetical protein